MGYIFSPNVNYSVSSECHNCAIVYNISKRLLTKLTKKT
jgi:hypothetical protein